MTLIASWTFSSSSIWRSLSPPRDDSVPKASANWNRRVCKACSDCLNLSSRSFAIALSFQRRARTRFVSTLTCKRIAASDSELHQAPQRFRATGFVRFALAPVIQHRERFRLQADTNQCAAARSHGAPAFLFLSLLHRIWVITKSSREEVRPGSNHSQPTSRGDRG